MASQTINFTKAALERIKPPVSPTHKKGGVSDTYKDTREKGLILIVSNGGAKTFYLYTKVKGVPQRIRLGQFPAMTIEQARKAVVEARSQIYTGKNPNEERRSLRQEITFGELFEQYMERYSKKQKRSWEQDEKEVNRFLSHWFKKRVSSITKQEIRNLHERIGEGNGIYQANRLFEKIRAIYNKGIEWGLNIPNPTTGIRKHPEKSRERFLQADELPCFWQALAEEENDTARDYIILSLLTGARKTNVLSMRWEDINFIRKEWFIPETKNGEAVTVPLSEQAMDILQRRRQEYKGSPWVFPSPKSSKGYLADPKKAWRRVLQRATIAYWELDEHIRPLVEEARKEVSSESHVNDFLHTIKKKAEAQQIPLPTGLMDLRLHDLRRTLGSWQAATGATTALIGKSLGHKSHQATAIYERLSIDPVRESVERATRAMMGGGGGH